MSTFIIAVDGSEGSIRAAEFATERAIQQNGKICVIHVLQWSPYSFLTPEELEERHKRRGEELSRSKSAIIDPILSKLESNGAKDVVTEVRYGNIAEVINKYAQEHNDSQIFIGRHGGSKFSSRLFGTVPASLVQISKVPVTVVP